MKVMTYSTTAKIGSMTVSDDVFGVKKNDPLLAQAVRVYLANSRQATKGVQTRADVNRTKRKWYKQKGTGNARHGARSAPIFVGGGVAHGPNPEQHFGVALSKQLKRKSLLTALSMQAANIIVIDQISQLTGKTKEAAAMITPSTADAKRVLVVVAEMLSAVARSFSNLPKVMVVTAGELNVLDVAYADKIVTTSEAIKILEARLLAKKATPKVVVASKVVAEKTPVVAKAAASKKVAVTKAAKPVAKSAAKKTATKAKAK